MQTSLPDFTHSPVNLMAEVNRVEEEIKEETKLGRARQPNRDEDGIEDNYDLDFPVDNEDR